MIRFGGSGGSEARGLVCPAKIFRRRFRPAADVLGCSASSVGNPCMDFGP